MQSISVPKLVSIADVQQHAYDLRLLVALHDFIGEEMLVVLDRDGSVAPFLFPSLLKGAIEPGGVGLSVGSGAWIESRKFPTPDDFKNALSGAVKESRAGFSKEATAFASISQVVKGFFDKAAAFLRERISTVQKFTQGATDLTKTISVRDRIDGQRVFTPGCPFTIHTNSTGLQVLWSPAYAQTPNYFGSPTTPVEALLQAGSYRFGVQGGTDSASNWATPIHTLPGSSKAHLPF